jgi:hypothetical protein
LPPPDFETGSAGAAKSAKSSLKLRCRLDCVFSARVDLETPTCEKWLAAFDDSEPFGKNNSVAVIR